MEKDAKAVVHRLSLDEVRKRRKELVFVDARSATALARNPAQIPGAVHIPLKELDKGAKVLQRGGAIVTYCT